jgi:hypothetical protein
MLTITGAARIVMDAGTERDGDLVIVDGRVAAEGPAPASDPPGHIPILTGRRRASPAITS